MAQHSVSPLMFHRNNVLAVGFHRGIDGGDVNRIIQIHIYIKIKMKKTYSSK